MGYYSDHFLLGGDFSAKEKEWAAANMARGQESNLAFFMAKYDSGFNARWYEIEEDMAKLSAAFPKRLYIIEVVGESSPDLWRLYAKGGNVRTTIPRIVWPRTPKMDRTEAQ